MTAAPIAGSSLELGRENLGQPQLSRPAELHNGPVRVTIRVRPGAVRQEVGGRHGDALVVRVTARAVDGKATQAALRAVAEAFGVRRDQVSLVSGGASRLKIVDIAGGDQAVLQQLLARE